MRQRRKILLAALLMSGPVFAFQASAADKRISFPYFKPQSTLSEFVPQVTGRTESINAEVWQVNLTSKIDSPVLSMPASKDSNEGDLDVSCASLPSLPERLDTPSKYEQDDPSRSRLAPEAATLRDQQLRPIRAAIRKLAKQDAACAAKTLISWAASGSLTDMASTDAYLTRDRLVVDITIAISELQKQNSRLAEDPVMRNWLRKLAQSTIDFYDWRAGPQTRRNNHRYWAGLSIGQIGFLLGDRTFVAWAQRSYEIGVCQVDAQGFLPLEVARGARALEYHLYALRPLAAFAKLARENGMSGPQRCEGGLDRLASLSKIALANGKPFVVKTGMMQQLSSNENSFSSALRLNAVLRM